MAEEQPPGRCSLGQRRVLDRDGPVELYWTDQDIEVLMAPGSLPFPGYRRVLDQRGVSPTVTRSYGTAHLVRAFRGGGGRGGRGPGGAGAWGGASGGGGVRCKALGCPRRMRNSGFFPGLKFSG